MSDTYTVRLEPIGVEFEVDEGETVLNAAFRPASISVHSRSVPVCVDEGDGGADGVLDLPGQTPLFRAIASVALPDLAAGRQNSPTEGKIVSIFFYFFTWKGLFS